ncbi:hypothetical protein pb186bvf_018925 [Paramecium bursaria]
MSQYPMNRFSILFLLSFLYLQQQRTYIDQVNNHINLLCDNYLNCSFYNYLILPLFIIIQVQFNIIFCLLKIHQLDDNDAIQKYIIIIKLLDELFDSRDLLNSPTKLMNWRNSLFLIQKEYFTSLKGIYHCKKQSPFSWVG